MPDLVDRTFGRIVPISCVAPIQLLFLHFGILLVKVDQTPLERGRWPEACANAALAEHYDSTVAEDLTELPNLNWEWNAEALRLWTGTNVDEFLNSIGLLAYIAAVQVSPHTVRGRKPTTRFTRLPAHYTFLPDPSRDEQDCQPDFFALSSPAFVKDSGRGKTRLHEFLEEDSVLRLVEKYAPALIHPYITGVNQMEPCSVPPNFLSDNNTSTPTLQLVKMLREVHGHLAGRLLPPPEWAVKAVRNYEESCFLDLSRVCLPNVTITGTTQTRTATAIAQTIDHMHQQRRTQPWLRFCLGLVATNDKVGLVHADAVGIEQHIIDNSTGSGIFSIIRLSLGLLVANGQELGVHPCFTSFREVDTPVSEAHKAIWESSRSTSTTDEDESE
ncbi:hypothetical protein H0H81_001698 [Sphagnurus paluster]|uniref:Uncharacterized protein n=1 Tax=Sphagnurus paluster TaxID=117069 RepID=A0A9P7KN56_9AGAR|nr:hypothetical protein H0H81_001698 [Sphagnurus paluster]